MSTSVVVAKSARVSTHLEQQQRFPVHNVLNEALQGVDVECRVPLPTPLPTPWKLRRMPRVVSNEILA